MFTLGSFSRRSCFTCAYQSAIQAYIAQLEHEKLVGIRITEGVNRAHMIDKSSTHPSYLSSTVIM